MNHSRISTYLLGVILMLVGIGILFDNLNIFQFEIGNLIVPIILVFIGIKLLDRGRRTAGGILLVIGVLMFLGTFINIGSVIGLAFSLAVIYFGYRMMRSKKKEFKVPSGGAADPFYSSPAEGEQQQTPADEQDRHSSHALSEKDKDVFEEQEEKREEPFSHKDREEHRSYSNHSPKVKHSLIGNLYLTAPRWELTDMNIWHGIGEVKIDLSRAFIHDAETVLIINGWIGDIDIYVPYDLEVAFSANVNIGDIDIFGNKEGGVNRNVSIETSGYRDSSKRVRVIVSLLIGDIDVMYV